MADTTPVTEVLSDSMFIVDIPFEHHCVLTGVFYGSMRKEVKVTNLSTGEVLANHLNCYAGWYACGTISARVAPLILKVELRCLDTACAAIGANAPVPISRTVDVGGEVVGSSTRWYMYAPNDVTLNERVGITIVVQAGLGPIDVG